MSAEEKKTMECENAEKKPPVHPIKGMMDTTLSRIKDMVDVTTIIGDPIVNGDVTIIPISKMSYGFASGGSDFDGKSGHRCFGGGGGAGVTVQPVAFLVITPTNVRLLQIDNNMNTLDKALGMIPNLVDQASSIIGGIKDRKKQDEPEVGQEMAEKAEILTLDENLSES